MTFLERLKELQDENQLSIVDIAKGSGLPYSTIASYKSRGSVPSMVQLTALADYFGCSIDYLVGRSDDFGFIQVTGDNTHSDNETQLLSYYRQLTAKRQSTLLDVANGLAKLDD